MQEPDRSRWWSIDDLPPIIQGIILIPLGAGLICIYLIAFTLWLFSWGKFRTFLEDIFGF